MPGHTFVVCAYKESEYLEECIRSLKAQTVPSRIVMATSTPNAFLTDICARYGLRLFVNEGESGITQDWNFAYRCADTDYVTLAHQDDVYREDYLERALAAVGRARHPLIFFSDYCELRGGKTVRNNTLLRVKRLMLLPLRIRPLWGSRWVRRRILSFGSPICCPSVLYVRENLPEKIFQDGFRSCEDWEAWEMLSKRRGSFVYDSEPLLYHRIHPDSETSAVIGDNARSEEEFIMYCKFWPRRIAALLNHQYARGQQSNAMHR